MNPNQQKIDLYKSVSGQKKDSKKKKPAKAKKPSKKQSKQDLKDFINDIDGSKPVNAPVKKSVPKISSVNKSSIPQEEDVSGLLKTTSDQNGIKKAAKLIILLGKDKAAVILNHLSDSEITKVMVEVAKIRKVDKVEAEHLLQEFDFLIKLPELPKGGKQQAKEFLTSAFGEDKAQSILSRALPQDYEKPFDFLNDLEYQQIITALKGEKATVTSVVLSFLEPELGAKVFESFHPDEQKEVIHRIAHMQKVHPDVLVKMEEVLREKVRRQGTAVTEEIDGRRTLANILKYSDPDIESEILKNLEQINPEISKEIKDLTQRIEIVEFLKAEDFEAILRDFSDSEISIILKGKSEELRSFFFKHLTDRRVQLIKEEMEYLGPMKKSDVLKSTKEFILYIKKLEDSGKISIYKDKDKYI